MEDSRRKEDRLGGFVLARRGLRRCGLLGKGAFSGVYRVEGEHNRVYACKVSENAGLLKREAGVMAMLDHPLFPAYYDFWEEAGLGFLLCEYVAGSSLEALLARRGRFTAEQTIRAGLALAEGLRYLHERPEGFLFRDVKPSNIIVRQDGGVKLIDLGCVCSMKAKPSARAGTPGFAAPEQLEGGMLTPACDVYGLGRTMEAMLGSGMPAGGCAGKVRLGYQFRRREKVFGRRRYKRLRVVLGDCCKNGAAERTEDMGRLILLLRGLEAGDGAYFSENPIHYRLCTKKNTKN